MCGIAFCCLCCQHDCNEAKQHRRRGNEGVERLQLKNKLLQDILDDETLDHRGPDVSKQYELPSLPGWMMGCVLHLRGQKTPQPLIDAKGNALLWNAEIFGGIEVTKEENDTQVLLNRLTHCEEDDEILKTMEEIHGPWAFIFWQEAKKTIWFGRDIYGRRSLLWHLPIDISDPLVLASVALGDLSYTEIPSVGIYKLNLSSIDSVLTESQTAPLPSIEIYPWLQCRWPGSAQLVTDTPLEELCSYLTSNQASSIIPVSVNKCKVLKHWIPQMCKTVSNYETPLSKEISCGSSEKDFIKHLERTLCNDERLRHLSDELISLLKDAVMKRVESLPIDHHTEKISEGCVSAAKIAVLFSGGLDSTLLAGLLDKCLPEDEPIDLLNVAFEQPPPVLNKTKRKQKKNKKLQNPNTGVNNILECATSSSLSSCNQQEASNINRDKDERLRSENIDEKGSSTLFENGFREKCNIESISKPTTETKQVNVEFDPFDVPDRRTGRIAFSELNPHRKWNFIEINVSHEELQSLRQTHIRKLIYPLKTVLDDSIGCAVWFAARGIGNLANDQGQRIFSQAKVLLCGMAADEQFAGYSRHRVHYHQFGEESLVNQLEQEIWRISARNLGRDDRIIADHGKEARFPFLDENFTEFVSKIPIHLRANLNLPRGLGEKLLLRLSAFSLDLHQTACQPKRAIQFGSKIAKVDDYKQKGSDICQKLL